MAKRYETASGFSTISHANAHLNEYDELRRAFARKHNIPENKVSMAMIIHTGMTYYKQRELHREDKNDG